MQVIDGSRWIDFCRDVARGAFYSLVAASVLAPGLAEAKPLGLESVHKLIAEEHIASIEELLARLPLVLRSRFALVFASRSLQGASLEAPRVILYGLDGKFVLTFNGNPQDKGYDTVEIMEFDDGTKQFRFQEVTFETRPDRPSTVQFSDVNPPRCAACHGAPARPIWDTHPSWPGVYGELYQNGFSNDEREGVAAFLRAQPSHPRYRHLAGIDGFVYRVGHRPSAKDRYDGVQAESPNAQLSALLTQLDFESILGMLKRQGNFEIYKHALLASLSRNCGGIEGFFPVDIGSAVKTRYRHFSERSDVLNQRQAQFKETRIRRGIDASRVISDAGVDDYYALKRFRFIAEMGLGLSTREWTLALEKDSYDFTALPSAIDGLEQALLLEVTRTDPVAGTLHLYESQGSGGKYCAHLEKQSRSILSQARPVLYQHELQSAGSPRGADDGAANDSKSDALAPAVTVPELAHKCVACHGTNVAPPLPLDEPESLRPLLHARRFPRGFLIDEILFRLSPEAREKRMPPDLIISEEEREAMARYLRALQR